MAISHHGELYALDSENLHALDEQGRLLWRVKTPGSPASALIVGQGGSLYYAGGDRLYGLAADGGQKWSRQVGAVVAGPVESSGGLILVATAQELVALRPGGDLEWSGRLGEPVPTRPLAAGADGLIYFRTRTALLVLNEKGQIKAEHPVTQFPVNLAVGDGLLQDGLTRRGSTGEERWTVALGMGDRSLSTMLDRQGNALIIESEGRIRGTGTTLVPGVEYRLWDPEGRQLWAALPEAVTMSEPSVTATGDICFIGRKEDNAPFALICMGGRP